MPRLRRRAVHRNGPGRRLRPTMGAFLQERQWKQIGNHNQCTCLPRLVFHPAKSILSLGLWSEAGGWDIRQPPVKTNGLRGSTSQNYSVCRAEGGRMHQLRARRFPPRRKTAGGLWHCAFYPMSSSAVADHQQELQGYDTSKGTIRLPVDKPLP